MQELMKNEKKLLKMLGEMTEEEKENFSKALGVVPEVTNRGEVNVKYLIKSIKWTDNDNVETWWGKNRSGYTTFICNAGVYSEEDKIKMAEDIRNKSVEFIPLTGDMINKGKEQLDQEIKQEEEDLVKIEEHYKSSIKSNKKQIDFLNSKFDELAEWEKMI